MKLVVLDVDGVLSAGEAHPFDLRLFNRLGELNRLAQQDSQYPAVTLNTGRPSLYVEAVMQAIQGWQPALYENGAGLYFPQAYRFEISPLLTGTMRIELDRIITALDEDIVRRGYAYWQPAKIVCHTLFAIPPLTIVDIQQQAEKIVTDLSDSFVVSPAMKALNIHPANINKGTGLEWLAQMTGIDPQAMAGAGDSSGDVDFLRLIGKPAAPANATADVKAVARYVSPYQTTAGLHDILDQWGL